MATSTSNAQANRLKGPLVWLDMDQKELDDAYDQSVYAPNQPFITTRRRLASEAMLKRVTPERIAYGAS
jgi:arylformamidase